jgi:hypothetical protein
MGWYWHFDAYQGNINDDLAESTGYVQLEVYFRWDIEGVSRQTVSTG